MRPERVQNTLDNYMRKIYTTIAVFSLILLTACTQNQPKEVQKNIETKVELPEVFKFHKAIEVKPGLTFDVVSWGRGSEFSGAYLILRSDSTKLKYRSTSGELEGLVTDAWNMDLDSDGNPEIFIQAKGEDKGENLIIYVYEFNDSGSAQELRFPQLTSSTKRAYRGKDSVYIKEGNLYREFPTYEEADTAALNPTGKKLLEYKLRGSSFSVNEIKETISRKKSSN